MYLYIACSFTFAGHGGRSMEVNLTSTLMLAFRRTGEVVLLRALGLPLPTAITNGLVYIYYGQELMSRRRRRRSV